MLIKVTDKIEYIEYKNWKLHYIKYLKFNKNRIQESASNSIESTIETLALVTSCL